jgi:hypothetical protein
MKHFDLPGFEKHVNFREALGDLSHLKESTCQFVGKVQTCFP